MKIHEGNSGKGRDRRAALQPGCLQRITRADHHRAR